MRTPIALGGALLLALSGQAGAWEYQSIKSGMTLEQATQALAGHEKRLTLFAEKTDENPGDVYLVEPETSMLLHVCNGVVNGYSDILPGSADAFVSRVAAESKARGTAPAKFVSASEAGNQLNKMSVEWNEPDGSQLSLNWSSLNGVSYATVAMRAACNTASSQAAPDQTGALAKNVPVPVPVPKASAMAETTDAAGTTAVGKEPPHAAAKATKKATNLAELCAEKFRSYNPKTGMFKDFSGKMRRCDKSLVSG